MTLIVYYWKYNVASGVTSAKPYSLMAIPTGKYMFKVSRIGNILIGV